MILKRLEIQGYGPFLLPTVLEVDQNVTVLTGSNDVGKSAILRLIQLLCSKISPVEDDQNFDHKYSSGKFWDQDDSVFCKATFVVDENFGQYFQSQNIRVGAEVDVRFNVTKNLRSVIEIRRDSTTVPVADGTVNRMPSVLYLSAIDEISPSFSFETANSLEKQLLSLAFGSNPQEKFVDLRPEFRNRDIRQANKIIQDRLSKVLPYSLGLGLTLEWHYSPSNKVEFSVNFEDAHTGLTTIKQRGTGIRKIVALVTSLVTIADTSDHTYLLLDEPENSLHADAQHKLRGFLETLANSPKIQVIYATHSSSMMNTLIPETVRLLKRVVSDAGTATTRIDNYPYRNNFISVRTSLGMSPTDSLLFGAVSIIIEGPTEAFCLPLIFQKLQQASISGFEKAMFLLSLSHFVSGGGDEYEYWCKFALDIGAKPILFLDGDKRRDLERRRFSEKYPTIRITLLPDKKEFENLVPIERYINALATEIKNDSLTYENYVSWNEKTKLHENVMLTKRVSKWVEESDIDEFPYNKPAVMKKAIELTPVEEIQTEELLKLLHDISQEMGEI